MSDDIRQIEPDDSDILEEWLRETGEPQVRAVGACKLANWRWNWIDWPEGDGWIISVWAMQFVNSDPLESELRQRIMSTLRGVSGVARVEEKGREEWFLAGTTSGTALVAAVAQVVDELADQIRRVYDMP